MSAVSSEGMVLHRRRWGETSALLDVITPEYGRISVLAKGYRSRKAMSGLLEPFQQLQLVWRGRGEMFTLTQVESLPNYWPLSGRRLFCGLYVNELLWRLLPQRDAQPEVYQQYQETLSALLDSETSMAAVLRIFEKNLLLILGFGLQLDIEADQLTPISEQLYYVYDPEEGPSQSTNKRAIVGASLLALHNETFTQPGQLADARRLLRQIIQHHLGSIQLQSYELLAGYSKTALKN